MSAKKNTVAPAGSFRQTFSELLKARHPVLLVESYEEDHVVEEITAIACDPNLVRTPRQIRVWSATSGLAAPGETARPAPRTPQAALEEALRATEPTVFIFKDLHHYLGSDHRPADPVLLRLLRDSAATFQRSEQPACLILLSPALSLPTDVEKDVTIVDFPLPEPPAPRRARRHDRGQQGPVPHRDRVQRRRPRAAHQGRPRPDAPRGGERLRPGHGRPGHLSPDDVAVVAEREGQTIRKSGMLEFVAGSGPSNRRRHRRPREPQAWLAKRDESWLD